MWQAALGAVGSLASTFLGHSNAKQANQTAAANAARQEALQREFAQNGISWKVADAKRAGIHPLYALGAQTTSYSPVNVGSQSTDFSGLASMGQNLGRAIDSTRDQAGKQAAALQTAFAQTQLEGAKLDNDIKRAKLASDLAVGRSTNPGIPLAGQVSQYDGQGNAITMDGPKVELETKRDVTDPREPSNVAGSSPSVAWVKNPGGTYSVVMPSQLAESYESDWMGALDWQVRNRILPYVTTTPHKPPFSVPAGYEAYFSLSRNGWTIRKKKGNSNAQKSTPHYVPQEAWY